MLSMRVTRFLVVALFCLPCLCAAAPAIGMFTIVDGDAIVIRGAQKFSAAEGLPVNADDIVHTGDATRIARVEFADGAALDLGPATRLWLRPRLPEPRAPLPADLYLAEGWVKLTTAPAHKLALASPRADLNDLAGVAVARVADNVSFLFIEAGSALLVERQHGQMQRSRGLKEGQAFDRRDGDAGAVISRPAPDMIETMPRSFADSLPLRAVRFQGSKVEPESPQAVGYPDVAGWINAERALRPVFVQRFAVRAGDPSFRAPLVAELRSHPEWTRVLFPEPVARKRTAPAPVLAARPHFAHPAAPLPARLAISESVPVRSARGDADRESLRPWEARKR
jgi:hypothetical protein